MADHPEEAAARHFAPDRAAFLRRQAGQAGFADTLLAEARTAGAVEELFAYQLDFGAPPRLLASASLRADAPQRVNAYSRRFHRIDPLLNAPPCHVRCITRAQIADPAYRRICYEAPRFSDKLSFAWNSGTTRRVLSFYRTRAGDALEVAALARLAEHALLALESSHAAATGDAIAQIEARLAERLPDLTVRERSVCARTIAGHSAKQIARALGIAPASVLTYRQRAYRRLGISSAGGLVAWCL